MSIDKDLLDRLMENPFGGIYGVQSDTFGNTAGINICLSNVPASAAEVMDNRDDDGQPDSGSIRGTLASEITTPANTDGYEGNAYTVCVNTDI